MCGCVSDELSTLSKCSHAYLLQQLTSRHPLTDRQASTMIKCLGSVQFRVRVLTHFMSFELFECLCKWAMGITGKKARDQLSLINPFCASSSGMQQLLAPAVFLNLAPNVQYVIMFKRL